MIVHEFVDGTKPLMVLVHGFLTPWQVWMPQIEWFKKEYNIYAIALNAHTEEAASEFVSVTNEAAAIERYFREKGIDIIHVLCGISLGGKIAHAIWKNGQLKIHHLIMDGAPLAACPSVAIRMMTKNYKNIIHKSKSRSARVIENFQKYFLPKKYLDSYLKIADLITDQSIENILSSVFSGSEMITGDQQSRLLFIHGTKGNEILSKKSAELLKKNHRNVQVVCFKGDQHCYKAIYQPEVWIATVSDFLKNR